MESAGTPTVLRFQVGRGSVAFEDLVHGRMSFDSEGIGDFILVRSDGMAAYNFACVIDDHLMETDIVDLGDDISDAGDIPHRTAETAADALDLHFVMLINEV
jgi:nondiscriminating glutamyl-tRNA synthetase